jgi:DEAD/DEAH box helicase domain-containing protein
MTIDRCGAPAAGRRFIFLNPQKLSAATAASRLLARAVARGLPTIVFTKARKMTELIYTWTVESNPRLRSAISAYRAGYLPEERREIERKLFTGELKAVISTSALEMGIDIGELELCVLVGYPGAIATTWQRGGRVGRQDRESLIVLVAQQDALDQYFMRHPEVFFASGFEPAVVDPQNLPISKAHLLCAAAELPLFADDEWFPASSHGPALAELEAEGSLLRSVSEGCRRSTRRLPQRGINIRGIGESCSIFEEPDSALPPGKKPRVIGSLEGNRVYSEGHPGAIYLHRAVSYQITRLDLARKNLFARPVRVNYYTLPRREKQTSILNVRRSKPVQNFVVRLGDLRVTERVTGYEKKRISGGERLSVHELDLPPTSFDTVGLWIEIEDFIPRVVAERGRNFMGGIHAVEHAAIALFPLFALCERDDVGGISIPLHPEVGKAAIFIYDGYPGGVGLAERSFERIEELLSATLNLIRECPCESGCPSCIHSPKCGNGNVPLDKEAAAMVLSLLLDRPEARAWLERPVAEEPPDYEPPPRPAPAERPAEPRVLVLDVETKRAAAEVGGWGNARLMGLALAAVWDSRDRAMHVYTEERAAELFRHLAQADVVVGFNLLGFDYTVLSAYDNGSLTRLPTFDLLYELRKKLGYRLSLGHLCEHTLGVAKSADGLQSLEWVKQGRMDLVEEYCCHDVALTRDLFYHCLEKRMVRFLDKEGKLMELGLDWDLDAIVKALKIP